jgi:ATP-dependent DNA helicase RecG
METQALFIETIPDYLLRELKLQKNAALFNIHFPKCRCFSQSSIRLKFEELFFIQLQLDNEKQDSKT